MEEIKNATQYAIDSNKLEGYILTEEEEKKVIDNINESDKSFTNDVLEMINEDNKKGETSNVKVRK